jgi:hypothetical protein
VTNGPVQAIARTADSLFIGGLFTYVGPPTGSGVPVDTGSGVPFSSFAEVNGPVETCAADGSGGWYIGGSFSDVGDLPRSGLAHIMPDGSVDPAWNPNPSGAVYDLVLSGSTLYAGGDFTTVGGQARNRIAALNASSGMATPWDPGADDTVRVLLFSDSTVYAGGDFTTIGGETRNRVAAIDIASGTATAWNPGASSPVRVLALSGTTLYVGNLGLRAVDTVTGTGTGWNPSVTGTGLDPGISALAVSGSTLYVGGAFSALAGQNRNNIAAFDIGTGNLSPWDPDAGDSVFSLKVSGTTVYVGGDFWGIGGENRSCVAAVEATTGFATAWNPGANGAVRALTVSGSAVYVGGRLSSVGGVRRAGLATLDPSTGAATDWEADLTWAQVFDLEVSDDQSTLFVGGYLYDADALASSGIAGLNVETGARLPWFPELTYFYGTPLVHDVAVSGSTLYIGGAFSKIDDVARESVAALDAITGEVTDWYPGEIDGRVYSLALSGDESKLYVGGSFYAIGSDFRGSLAAVDAVSGSVTDWAPFVSGETVDAIAISEDGSTVYVGGWFTSIDFEPRNNLAALDAVTGDLTGWDPGPNAPVRAISLSGSTVYVGGRFTTIGGETRNRVGAVDGVTGGVPPWDPDIGDELYMEVWGLLISDWAIDVGGNFATVGGQPRHHFGIFTRTSNPNASGVDPLWWGSMR